MKTFHIIFISLSSILSFFFGIWCVQSHFTENNPFYAMLGLLSIVMALGLIVYGIYFLQKMKQIKK